MTVFLNKSNTNPMEKKKSDNPVTSMTERGTFCFKICCFYGRAKRRIYMFFR